MPFQSNEAEAELKIGNRIVWLKWQRRSLDVGGSSQVLTLPN